MTAARRPYRLIAAATAALLLLPVGGVIAGQTASAAPEKKTTTAGLRAFADFYQPAPYTQVLKQPDGTSVSAVLTPAEVGGAFEVDGYTVTRGSDRVWRYASGRTKAGELVPTRLVAGKAAPTGLRPHAGRTPDAFTDSRGRDIRTETFRQLQIASRKAQMKAAEAGKVRTFKFPVLMLATWWDAENGQTAPQFQDKTGSPDYFKKLLDGFGGNPNGTLTEFYFEDSFGQFLVQVDVYGPYTSQRSRQDRCYYGGIEPGDDGQTDLDLLDDQLGIGGGGGIGMAGEAVPVADVDVDFSQYDNDGDSVVDFVGIVHSGADMAVTGDPCNTWSHAIQITLGLNAGTPLEAAPLGLATNDGVFVDRVFTMPEFNDPTHPLTIGVATHEMAHALGEPDYYNTSYTSMGSGDWDIMSGGSYLGNPAGSNPSGFNPASRVFQGWLNPTVVTSDMPQVTLQPRHIKPPGYDVSKPDPNLLLVSLKEIAVGEDDGTGYEWTQNDVYGLAKNPRTGKFVIEGYYLENMSRTVNAAPIHPKMTRSPYFDRQLLGSGIMAWHFDYWLRSNVYFGSNNAQNDANRPQMDVMEWDRNDNTQEQQLSLSRGNAEDLVFGAATGITSGTRRLEPNAPPPTTGTPQASIPISGAVVGPVQQSDTAFVVQNNPNNYLMTVEIAGLGDCKLQLLYEGKAMGSAVDSGSVGDPEVIKVVEPRPGKYTARVTDFAGCGPYEGSVSFENSGGRLDTKGAADTWSNWSKKPTGWAITNVGPGTFNGLDHSADAGGTEAITLDLLQVGPSSSDLSVGLVTGANNAAAGLGGLNVGRANPLQVAVFNNGGKAVGSAVVQLRDAGGKVVGSKAVSLAGYSRKDVAFSYTPAGEGSLDLTAVVDPAGAVAEKTERNNSQRSTLWAGPSAPRVLVVDDDGLQDGESTYAGALAALGVPYAVVTEHADAATLKQYAAVLWETGGERYQGQLDASDRAALRSYLDGGGKAMVNGARIADALGEAPGRTNPGGSAEGQKFLKQYLGADYISAASPNNDDRAASGRGIFGSRQFEISQLPGRHIVNELGLANYDTPVSDETKAAAIGTPAPAMAWEGAAKDSWLGVSVTGDAAHKRFKTVTLGFNLSQLTSADQHIAAVRSVLGFFGVPTGTYAVSTPEPVIYHSAVRNMVSHRPVKVRAVVLGGKAGAPVTLFYRRHGKGGYYAVPMAKGTEKGAYLARIPREAVTPDGVDYYLKAGSASTYDPPLAGQGVLAHAIGVALPEVGDAVAVLGGTQTPADAPTTPQAAPETPLAATGGSTGLALLALVLIGVGIGGRRFMQH